MTGASTSLVLERRGWGGNDGRVLSRQLHAVGGRSQAALLAVTSRAPLHAHFPPCFLGGTPRAPCVPIGAQRPLPLSPRAGRPRARCQSSPSRPAAGAPRALGPRGRASPGGSRTSSRLSNNFPARILQESKASLPGAKHPLKTIPRGPAGPVGAPRPLLGHIRAKAGESLSRPRAGIRSWPDPRGISRLQKCQPLAQGPGEEPGGGWGASCGPGGGSGPPGAPAARAPAEGSAGSYQIRPGRRGLDRLRRGRSAGGRGLVRSSPRPPALSRPPRARPANAPPRPHPVRRARGPCSPNTPPPLPGESSLRVGPSGCSIWNLQKLHLES